MGAHRPIDRANNLRMRLAVRKNLWHKSGLTQIAVSGFMTAEEIKARIVGTLPRDLLIDLLDTAAAWARQAHEPIRDNTDLTGRIAPGLEGPGRFGLMEEGYQDTCECHGGRRHRNRVVKGKNSTG